MMMNTAVGPGDRASAIVVGGVQTPKSLKCLRLERGFCNVHRGGKDTLFRAKKRKTQRRKRRLLGIVDSEKPEDTRF